MEKKEISSKEKTECLKAIRFMLRKDLKENSYAGWTAYKGFQVPKYRVVPGANGLVAAITGLAFCALFGWLFYVMQQNKKVIDTSNQFYINSALEANAYRANLLH